MAIITNDGRAAQQGMLEVLKHCMHPDQFAKLLKGEYTVSSDKSRLTGDTTIVVMDQNTLIHKEIISEDFFAQEKAPMSNKFLPFIVETSTPLHIFKTLLSRSKSMNQLTITSIFYLILERDIKELRNIVKQMPEMSLEKIYEELLIKYPSYRIYGEILETFYGVIANFPEGDHWHSDLNSFCKKDIVNFIAAMSHTDKDLSEYTQYPFKKLVSSEPDKILKNVTNYINFSDSGTELEFSGEADLRSFILYHGLFRKEVEPAAPYPGAYKASFHKNEYEATPL